MILIACPDDPSIPLKWLEDKQRCFCRERGRQYTKEEIFPPPKPKPQSIKQKDTKQTSTFIKQIPEQKKKKSKLGFEYSSSELSYPEYSYIAGIYGNITDFSDSRG